MKRLIALISAFFVLFSFTANAAYTGAELYNSMERAFSCLEEKSSPLGGTDSVAADYYVMALRRAGKVFDYNKYIQIVNTKEYVTKQDAHRIITAVTASGGRFPDEFVAENTYDCEFQRAADTAAAMIAVLSGEYEVKSDNTDISRMAVKLLERQNTDGGFDNDVLATSKSIIALSFLSGNCYIVKGSDMGEKYRYDVNSAILRGVDYLQNNKNEDCGFGSVINTSFAIMALDSAGVDVDNDPGFSDGTHSTLSSLLSMQNTDGGFGEYIDDTAVALCALVSHLRAMQGNSMFYALRTEDMPYNPNDYIEDINRSGEGLKVETQNEIQVVINDTKVESDSTEKPYELAPTPIVDTKTYDSDRKSAKVLSVVVVIISVIVIAAVVTGFVLYMIYVRPKKVNYNRNEKEEDG